MSTSFGRNNGLTGEVAQATYRNAPSSSSRYTVSKSSGDLMLSGLLSNKLLSALPDEEFVRLVPHLEPTYLSAGENLNNMNTRIEFAYFPEDCVVSCLGILEDGSTPEVCVIGKEGMVGIGAILGSASPVEFSQVAVAGSAMKIKSKILAQEFNRSGVLAHLLLGYTSEYIRQISQRAICGVRHQVKNQFVNWLLMIHDRLDTDEMLFTHDFIAQRLGARRSGITVAANELQDQCLISYARGHIHILDRQGLEAAACECYDALGKARDWRFGKAYATSNK